MAKAIDVKGQIRLGFTRTFGLTVNGVRFRLFRSSVTVVVIAVAIAFLMNILAEGLVKGSIARSTGDRIKKSRRASRWASRLSVPGTLEEILHEVARSGRHGAVCKEIVNIEAIGRKDVGDYHAAAERASTYLEFFDGLDHVDRRQLVGNATGTDVFDRLRDRSAFVAFEEKLAKLRSVSLEAEAGTSARDLWGFLEAWSALEQPRPDGADTIKEQTLRIQRKRAEAIVRIREWLAGRTVIDGLAGADGEFGEVVKAAGFVFEDGARSIIAEQARRIRDMRALEGTLGKRRARQFIAAEVDVNPAQVNVVMLWKLMRSRRVAARYLERLRHVEQETRLGLFCGAVRDFLKELGDASKEKLEAAPEGLRARYLKPDGTASSFHDARAGEAVRRLSASARDAWRLIERFRGDAEASGLDSYGSLGKLLETECVSTDEPQSPEADDPDAGDRPARVKLKPLMADVEEPAHGGGPRPGAPAYALGVKAVVALARRRGDEFALARAERATAGVGGGIFGIGERMTWLVLAAMLVSVVGVTNAMLMSVTERFREIATLKCLGALDGTIMLIFVMEAGMLGVVGGVSGAFAGITIGLLRMSAGFGTLVFSAFPAGAIVLAMLLSTIVGVVLAAIASVYPSFRAARLAPMEAMRIQ